MNTVYVCSNEYCGVVWNADPQGHCPECKRADGTGWSTITTEVRSLPKPASRDLVDYGYAPGGYISRCVDCTKTMEGVDKRCMVCKPCAEKRRDRATQPPAAEPVAYLKEWQSHDGMSPGKRTRVDRIPDVEHWMTDCRVTPLYPRPSQPPAVPHCCGCDLGLELNRAGTHHVAWSGEDIATCDRATSTKEWCLDAARREEVTGDPPISAGSLAIDPTTPGEHGEHVT